MSDQRTFETTTGAAETVTPAVKERVLVVQTVVFPPAIVVDVVTVLVTVLVEVTGSGV